MSDACAAIVARDDPHLHATALFAPEPGRTRLMVLYAFDVELSRAAAASAEPLIARMRLQWWCDVVEAARAGAPPPPHEVAGPFARLLAEQDLPGEAVEGLIAAREAEQEGGFDAARFATWAHARFGGLTALAARLLAEGDAETIALARRAGPVLGAAFALRHAAAMAGQGGGLLPDLTPEDRAALAGGELTPHACAVIRAVAGDGLARLAELRAERGRVDRRATPAFLPLVRARRVLARAMLIGAPPPQLSSQRGEGVHRSGGRRRVSGRAPVALRQLDAERAFDGLRLAWAAATGRW